MRRLTRFAFVLLAGAANAPAQTGADFSGIDQFWQISETLRAGTEPTTEAWDQMFATPGYAALEARERRRASMVVAMRAAFRPDLRSLRDSLLTANGWPARVIRHIEALPARRAQLDAFAARMRRDTIVATAARQSQTLLPTGTVRTYGVPTVAFLFFLPDGRGYPGLIVADLANVMSKPHPIPFFAHEVTHFYWAQLARARGPVERSPLETSIVTLLGKIAEESIGDQFDKSPVIDATDDALAREGYDASWREYIADYRREFARAGDELTRLDTVIALAAADSVRGRAAVDSAARAVPLEGRPVGMYMARAIRRVLGDSAFAASVGAPVEFFLAYTDAASRPSCRCVALSPPTAALLRRLR